MTWLDLICVVFLAIVGIGGFAEGFIRGFLRLLALLAGGALGALFVPRLGAPLGVGAAIGVALAAGMGAMLVTGLLAWSAARAIPGFIHDILANRLLGVVPAVMLALLILTLALGLAERIADAPETQEFLRSGTLTGPLIDATDLLEQTIAGVR